MTREQLAHLDARYKALHKSGSADTERAFHDWRLAAVAYAEERRSVDRADLRLGDLEEVVASELPDELTGDDVVLWGSVGVGPAEEVEELHAPIFDQEQSHHQSRFFTGEEHA